MLRLIYLSTPAMEAFYQGNGAGVFTDCCLIGSRGVKIPQGLGMGSGLRGIAGYEISTSAKPGGCGHRHSVFLRNGPDSSEQAITFIVDTGGEEEIIGRPRQASVAEG